VPRPIRSVPAYRKHRHSGQAIVTLSGQDYYLGPHGTKVSRDAYDARIAEWLARGRRPLDAPSGDAAQIANVELIVAYKRHAEAYYRKNGKITNEVAAILNAAKVVKHLSAQVDVHDGSQVLVSVTALARSCSMKIDLSESLLKLSCAGRILPDRPHSSTLHRWHLRGVRGIHLETILIGGIRYTSREALQRFFNATTAIANGEISPASTSTNREQKIKAAERELAEDGVV